MTRILLVVMTLTTFFLLDSPIDKVIFEDLTFTIEGRERLYEGVVYGRDICVYENNKRIYKRNYEKIRPWAIDLGDLEDDGILDVYIGAYRATDYYPLAKRPFFFEWQGKMIKKWTGSYLSYNTLVDLKMDGMKVITREFNDDNYYEGIYMWQHFGFVQLSLEEL